MHLFGWYIIVIFQMQLTESRYGLVHGIRTSSLPSNTDVKHWYDGVSQPVFDEKSPNFASKEGQLVDEVPTSRYFSAFSRGVHKTRKNKPSFHEPATHLKQPYENDYLAKIQTETPASTQTWMKENGYSWSDFGLSENGSDDVPMYEENNDDDEGMNTRFYNKPVHATYGLSNPPNALHTEPSPNAYLTESSPTEYPMPTYQTVAKQHLAHKPKEQKRVQTLSQNLRVPTLQRKHYKKKQLLTQQNKKKQAVSHQSIHLQKIMKLISLVKDFSNTNLRAVEEQTRNLPDQLTTYHQPPVTAATHHFEDITSHESVPEYETASSDAEASRTSAALRRAASQKFNHKYLFHFSPRVNDVRNHHHLVTVDTTTGNVYGETTLAEEKGFLQTGSDMLGFKKSSMTYIPKHAKEMLAKRRAVVTRVKPARKGKKNKKTGENFRKRLLKKIKEDMDIATTKELKVLETKLEKMKLKRKKTHHTKSVES